MSIYETSITNPKKQLEFYKDLSEQLEQENQELKKQLKEINAFINNSGFANIEQVMLDYHAKMSQQKKFIEWLERRLFVLRDEASELALGMCSTNYQDTKIEVYKEVLSKYKEIIGVKDE